MLYRFQPLSVIARDELNARPRAPLPTRAEQIERLKTQQFDVLVIGGGATGTATECKAFFYLLMGLQ